MRPFYLFLSLFCILVLTACGSEEELTPPAFSEVAVNDSLVTTESLLIPFSDSTVTITGTIDDLAATIVANSTATGEKSVTVQNDGTWSFLLTLKNEGANIVSFTASDQRGNINQLVLTVRHDTTAPLVTAAKQGLDPLDPNVSQLIVTFNEKLLNGSLATAFFDVDGTPLTGAILDTTATNKIVTLPLNLALATGISHKLTYNGVTDIATPTGNSTDNTYTFEFTIVE